MTAMLSIIVVVVLASIATLLFSSLHYALRELSRVRFGHFLERTGRAKWLEPTFDHLDDLVVTTALLRLIANTLILLGIFWAFEHSQYSLVVRYALSFAVSCSITVFTSVAIPHALARHGGDAMVGTCIVLLQWLRKMFWPAIKVMGVVDDLVRRLTGSPAEPLPDHIEQEILSVVQEGEKEGVVDQEEREMIKSVIDFHDTTAGQVMTSRPEIIGLPVEATLDEVKQLIEASGHSRIPVYEGTLDHIVGILYARDLLIHLGQPGGHRLDLRARLRPTFYVPQTKPLVDLLSDFKLQKVHIAIVLDEYGGTTGLVTIEDVLEELVGDISDEHEPIEPAMFRRVDDFIEADARIYIGELNRLAELDLPEDAGFETLGGFVTTTLGRIPETGATFEQAGARFTVLDAEPHKVNRLKIEMVAQAVEPSPAK